LVANGSTDVEGARARGSSRRARTGRFTTSTSVRYATTTRPSTTQNRGRQAPKPSTPPSRAHGIATPTTTAGGHGGRERAASERLRQNGLPGGPESGSTTSNCWASDSMNQPAWKACSFAPSTGYSSPQGRKVKTENEIGPKDDNEPADRVDVPMAGMIETSGSTLSVGDGRLRRVVDEVVSRIWPGVMGQERPARAASAGHAQHVCRSWSSCPCGCTSGCSRTSGRPSMSPCRSPSRLGWSRMNVGRRPRDVGRVCPRLDADVAAWSRRARRDAVAHVAHDPPRPSWQAAITWSFWSGSTRAERSSFFWARATRPGGRASASRRR